MIMTGCEWILTDFFYLKSMQQEIDTIYLKEYHIP